MDQIQTPVRYHIRVKKIFIDPCSPFSCRKSATFQCLYCSVWSLAAVIQHMHIRARTVVNENLQWLPRVRACPPYRAAASAAGSAPHLSHEHESKPMVPRSINKRTTSTCSLAATGCNGVRCPASWKLICSVLEQELVHDKVASLPRQG